MPSLMRSRTRNPSIGKKETVVWVYISEFIKVITEISGLGINDRTEKGLREWLRETITG